MLPAVPPLAGPDLFLATIGGAEVVGAGVGLVAVVLAWQLWRTQRLYALELAEQAAQVAEEREEASLARQEKDRVVRENKAKSEMIATLSREIRGHLNGIIGSADLLLDNTLKARQRAHLATLRASAESLHQSLTDVVDYSSIETGHLQIASAVFDLRTPLAAVVESLSALALLKGLELVLIVTPDVPVQLIGDATRLRQILINLMSNAVKFTAQGRVVLRVTLSPTTPAGVAPGTACLHFSVSDSGAGIPEELLATIFDHTESVTTSPRNFGGSGLELAISKRLVELMGGTIGARSLPEGGSEFWADLALPVAKEQPSTGMVMAGGLHVVVLDDLTAARVAVAAMLARLNVDQDSTDTVAKAATLLRDAAEADAVDLVLLLDESVAHDQGAELARLVAEDSTLGATRIVLLARDPDAAAVTGYGFTIAGLVRKPLLRLDILAEALRPTTAGAPSGTGSRAPFEFGGGTRPGISRRPSVLVVDDDNISRSVSFQLLEILGCVVEVVTSGPEAIERASQAVFDLILMDCQMPEMDGFEATQRILAAAKGKPAPIVALTANTSAADREKCFAAGMSDFVEKPVHKADLARMLKRWVPAAPALAARVIG